jgi:dipeptidyl aminopeptidase/acylaminoacyl peptidase
LTNGGPQATFPSSKYQTKEASVAKLRSILFVLAFAISLSCLALGPVMAQVTFASWSEVPGGGTTRLPLTAVNYNNKLYLFGVGIGNNRHFMNVFDGARWSGWSEVPGGGTTYSADTATELLGKLYLFGIGIGTNKHFVNVFDASHWSGWSAVPGTGTAASNDTAVALNNKLYLIGLSNNTPNMTTDQYFWDVLDGNTSKWSGWNPVTGDILKFMQTGAAYHNSVYLFAIGMGNIQHFVNVFDGARWSGWGPIPGGGTTRTADAAVVFQDSLYLFGLDATNHHHFVNAFNGSTWSGWKVVAGNGVSHVADTAVVYGTNLYLFGIGDNSHIFVNVSH